MKAVLIGSDFMYRQDGKLVPIEINTNVAFDSIIRVEDKKDVWSLDSLVSFVREHGITEIYLESRIQVLEDTLKSLLGETCTVSKYDMSEEPEDLDTRLICRTSYSDEAVVDSYCRDKNLFLNLIKDEEFGSEQLLKTSEGLSGEITYCPDNGSYPNFIVKYRYPQYDIAEYPALYKFNTVEEVRSFAENELQEDFYITQYYYNEDHLLHIEGFQGDRIKLYRNWSLFINNIGNLESISLGTYTKFCKDVLGEVEYVDSKVVLEDRNMFLTKTDTTTGYTGDVLVEKTDLVLMSDVTWKEAKDLAVGDEVLSLDVPTEGDVDIRKHIEDYNITLNRLRNESEYVSSNLKSKLEYKYFIDKVKLFFTDGTDWFDTVMSSYMVLDSEDETVMFNTVDKLVEGQTVLLLNTESETPVYVEKVVDRIETSREFIEGYQLTLSEPYIFLTKAAGDESAYASIEHNAVAGQCICIASTTIPTSINDCTYASDQCDKGWTASCGYSRYTCSCACSTAL